MSAYSDAVLATSSLVAYWRLNETVGLPQDSKSTNHATAEIGTVLRNQAQGFPNDPVSMRFQPGSNFTVPHASPLWLNGAFTVEFWAKVANFPATSAFPGVMKKGNAATSGATGGWLVWYFGGNPNAPAGQLDMKRSTASAPHDTSSNGVLLTTSAWKLVHWTYAGGTATPLVYVDGSLAQTGTSTTYATLTSTNVLELGRADDQTGDLFLSNIALYSDVLDATTIANRYTLGQQAPAAEVPQIGVTMGSIY